MITAWSTFRYTSCGGGVSSRNEERGVSSDVLDRDEACLFMGTDELGRRVLLRNCGC